MSSKRGSKYAFSEDGADREPPVLMLQRRTTALKLQRRRRFRLRLCLYTVAVAVAILLLTM